MPRASLTPGERAGLLEHLYSAALCEESWEPVLVELARRFEARGAQLLIGSTSSPALLYQKCVGYDDAEGAEYGEFLAEDPRVPLGVSYGRRGRPFTETLMPDFAAFRRSRIYNEFLVPRGAACSLGRIDQEDGFIFNIAVMREKPHELFDPSDVAVYASLQHHLSMAMRVYVHVRGLGPSGGEFLDRLFRLREPMVLVDAKGRILFANENAESYLAPERGFRVEEGYLSPADPRLEAQWSWKLRVATSDRRTRLELDAGNRPMMLAGAAGSTRVSFGAGNGHAIGLAGGRHCFLMLSSAG